MTRPQDVQLPIAGLDTARFDCVFPTCGGVCCKNGRPPVEEAENARIEANLAKILPHLLPKARAVVETKGFRTERKKEGLRALAVVDGWCVFHNEGCVLHKVGASEGDRWKYKPWRCIAFPLERSKSGVWHVRQWKVKGEAWDLFCLNPKESPKKASKTLAAEMAFVRELDGGKEAWRFERPVRGRAQRSKRAAPRRRSSSRK
ncbi:MAG: DUF3109 family protein [Planctomycetes bacterium]|nr:DUF3109 family protein [Planctomycetota bacterium]